MELISREEAIKTIHKYFIKLLDKIPTETDGDGDTVYSDMKTLNSLLTINKWITKEIKALPTTEERKSGHWIDRKELIDADLNLWGYSQECSLCGFVLGAKEYNYCPNCGARMEEESNGIINSME